MSRRNIGEKAGREESDDPWFPGLDCLVANLLLAALGIKRSEVKGIDPATVWGWEFNGVRAREKSKVKLTQAQGLDRESWDEAERFVLRLKRKREQLSQEVAEREVEVQYPIELKLTSLIIELLKSNGEVHDQIAGLRTDLQRLTATLEPRKLGRPRRSPR